MTETKSTSPDSSVSRRTRGSSTRRSRKRQPRLTRLRTVWSEWRLEIIVLLLVVLAIFLLVEEMQIRETLLGWLDRVLEAVVGLSGRIGQRLVDFVGNTTLSDLIGYALLSISLVFVAWRLRWRLMTMSRFTTRKCPECGGELQRIHRHRTDRILDLYIPVRRYRCKDRDCGWRGLRTGRRHHH